MGRRLPAHHEACKRRLTLARKVAAGEVQALMDLGNKLHRLRKLDEAAKKALHGGGWAGVGEQGLCVW